MTQCFDFVIVGAGSAGCVLAARLTENPNTRVLLLESGPSSDDPLIDDPKNWFRLTFGDYVWPDRGAPQTHADGRELAPIHGKLVGGSSAINAMIHHHPVPGDIDQWGLPGWSWRDLEPMLLRSETWLNGPSPKRGSSGPIKVLSLPDPPPIADATMSAAEKLGLGVSDDLNGEVKVGAGLNQLAFDGVRRQHTGFSYLHTALHRPNLTIQTDAHVNRLLIENAKCTGVSFQAGGSEHEAEAARVVLSAGALRSPTLLMLSGVGPPDHLRKFDIPVRMDAEGVGQNLHDHLLIAGHNYGTTSEVEQSDTHGSVVVVYATSEYSDGARDIMLNVSTTPTIFPPLQSPEHGFKTTFSFTKPKSRGQIRLASADPAVQPIIDHRIFSEPTDLEGTIAALDLSRRILGSKEFDVFNGVEQNLDLLGSIAGMGELIISGTTAFGHHCGTCHMGKDDSSVVDENLRVRDIENLYVVDASIIPEIPSCPTNALVVAMAELAAARFVAM